MPRPRKPASPFRYFNSSPEVIRLVVMMYVRFPLSLRNVEDLLFERGIDICHETVRMWWNRFGPMFAGDIRRQRVSAMRGFRHWRWHLDEMYVKLNGEMVYLWRAVDHEGEVLESFITKARDKDAALRFMKRALKRHGSAGEKPMIPIFHERGSERAPVRNWDGIVATGIPRALPPKLYMDMSLFFTRQESLGERFVRYISFAESEIEPMQSDPSIFYDANGKLKPRYAASVAQLRGIIAGTRFTEEQSRTLKQQIEALN